MMRAVTLCRKAPRSAPRLGWMAAPPWRLATGAPRWSYLDLAKVPSASLSPTPTIDDVQRPASARCRCSKRPISNRSPSVALTEWRNGLLLRSDLHTLFDRGYVTVAPGARLEVSRRIRQEFENGRDYYALNGKPVRLPSQQADRPLPALLAWHNENVFLG